MALVVTYVVVQLVGRVDWGEVRDALTHLAWWHAPLLLAVLVLRQVLNALPLSLYIPGVSAYRATLNDQVAILMSTGSSKHLEAAMDLCLDYLRTSAGRPA